MPDSHLTSNLRALGFTPEAAESVAARPPVSAPGCEPWCHGRGARRLAAEALPLDPTHVPTMAETLRTLRYDYCRCPAGDAARDRHDTAIRAAAAREVQLATARLWDTAQIPSKLRAFTIESYLRLPRASRPLVDRLRRWQLAAGLGATLILHGPQGTCKTSLAASLLQEHLEDGRDGLFLFCRDWLSEVRSTYRPGRTADDVAADEWQMIRKAASVSFLVVDDVEPLSPWGQGILFSLLNLRDAWLRPTILTTNLDLDALEASVGKRTFDRLRGSALDPRTGETFVCELTGESRRGLVAPS